MEIKAIFFDLGGVILRTENRTPRANLAREFGMSYEEMDRFVFECESSGQASIGKLTAEAHWLDVTHRLNRPETDMPYIRDTFFGGDLIDQNIINLLRVLRKTHKTGLISNAWNDLRNWLAVNQIEDAFDHLTISAEVGIAKPDARIYQFALDQLGVKPAEAVFVDDVEKNITGCEAIGMHGILFRNASQTIGDIKQILES